MDGKIVATYIGHMGSDLSVVNSARVSFGKKSEWADQANKYLFAEDRKLIQYLAKHKHTSPFGHAFASFHVKAPIFVARQLVKHKFLRWNEISRRYVSVTPEFYLPDVWRKSAEDVKQGSSDEPVTSITMQDYGESYEADLGEIASAYLSQVDLLYNSMIDSKVCPEQARMILPQNMMTEWYWSGSLDAFADMCRLRLKPDTQEESRQVAAQIDTAMRGLFPVSWEALLKDE